MIEAVTDAFHQRLEGNEIEHHPGVVQFAFQCHRHLIVVAMERLPLATGENQKMRRGKIEIILGDFDAENF